MGGLVAARRVQRARGARAQRRCRSPGARCSPAPVSPRWSSPTATPPPTRFWISYFDAGEYLLGKNANALELGCDCLGVIRYFDGYVADDHGHAVQIPNAVCMHEEDYGVLWKHTEMGPVGAQVRRSRRLVVSRTSPRSATTTTASTGTSTSTARSRSRPRPPGSSSSARASPASDNSHAPEIAPGVVRPGAPAPVLCAAGRRNRRRGQPPRRDRRARIPMGPGNRVRQRVLVDARRPAHRVRGAARRRHLGRPRVGSAERIDARTTSAARPRTT